jgi:AcrR family transcriptional regulator
MDTRQRILEVTAELLQRSGVEPPSTRAICEAAGVSAPTLYHHFGDKDGLYDAVVQYGFESYLRAKHALVRTDDPVDDLRRAWDTHVQFGVTHPALYTLMYGTPRAGVSSPAAAEADAVLVDLLERVARAGRLRVPLERAIAMIAAACVGSALQAIRAGYDPAVGDQLRDSVLAAVVTERAPRKKTASVSSAANQLSALLREREGENGALSGEELALLNLWLARLG